jgi:hypothetical protein
MRVPVTLAAVKPATDLRGASGRRRIGRREGRRDVLEPKKRPKVDAVVSAQERLLKRIGLVKFVRSNRQRTDMRIETAATSRG